VSSYPQLWWWIARSSGILTWALVTANIIWGLVASSRIFRNRGARPWTIDVHRYLGTLALVFLGIHMFAMWADSYTHFTASDLFVPFASAWRTRAVAWGIVGLYLLLATEITSWLMNRMPKRAWHLVHLSSYLIFVTATVHGYLAGADRNNVLVQWLALTGIVMVISATVARVATTKKAERSHHTRKNVKRILDGVAEAEGRPRRIPRAAATRPRDAESTTSAR